MKHSRLLFFVILAFSLGFAVHWLITDLQIKPELGLPPQLNIKGVRTIADNFITYVNYDGNEFNPNRVTIKKGDYIAITNTSKDKLMWLVSDNPDLNTARGYGESERLKIILFNEGSYKVANKLDSKVPLAITVE